MLHVIGYLQNIYPWWFPSGKGTEKKSAGTISGECSGCVKKVIRCWVMKLRLWIIVSARALSCSRSTYHFYIVVHTFFDYYDCFVYLDQPCMFFPICRKTWCLSVTPFQHDASFQTDTFPLLITKYSASVSCVSYYLSSFHWSLPAHAQ